MNRRLCSLICSVDDLELLEFRVWISGGTGALHSLNERKTAFKTHSRLSTLLERVCYFSDVLNAAVMLPYIPKLWTIVLHFPPITSYW